LLALTFVISGRHDEKLNVEKGFEMMFRTIVSLSQPRAKPEIQIRCRINGLVFLAPGYPPSSNPNTCNNLVLDYVEKDPKRATEKILSR
jgi:hypothetical protein